MNTAGRAAMSAAMAEMADHMSIVADAVDGHRAHARQRGYSEGAAEAMACAYHNYLLAVLARSANTEGE